jgi:hypothetical protein
MADEANIPTHRWYQNRYHIKLPMGDVSESVIKAAGILKIDQAIVAPLFAAGEQGVWYDPSDLTTLFQDSAGTTPVTAAGQPVGKMLDKSGRGNHATQSISLQCPTYQIDGTGRPYLSFDGIDDWMSASALNLAATEDLTVFAGVRKLTNAARQMVAESAALGAFQLNAPASTTGEFTFGSKGSATQSAIASSAPFAAPVTTILTGIGKISTDTTILRVNGTQAGSSSADQGTGNYGSGPLYIGRRDGGTLHFNGNLYSLIVRGAQSTSAQIAATEAWVNAKTGAY